MVSMEYGNQDTCSQKKILVNLRNTIKAHLPFKKGQNQTTYSNKSYWLRHPLVSLSNMR